MKKTLFAVLFFVGASLVLWLVEPGSLPKMFLGVLALAWLCYVIRELIADAVAEGIKRSRLEATREV